MWKVNILKLSCKLYPEYCYYYTYMYVYVVSIMQQVRRRLRRGAGSIKHTMKPLATRLKNDIEFGPLQSYCSTESPLSLFFSLFCTRVARRERACTNFGKDSHETTTISPPFHPGYYLGLDNHHVHARDCSTTITKCTLL